MRGSSHTPSKRSHSRISQSRYFDTLPASDRSHVHSERVEPRRPSSKLERTINIHDLPDCVLVEILCRLPCYKFVNQCKFVCKHWCSLISNSYFITRFLSVRSDHQQAPIISTLINETGNEFLARMSSSSSAKPLSPLFERIKSFHCLKKELVVVSTYNDLVLCCAGKYDKRDYYICNPYTLQWIPLPPPPPRPFESDHIIPIGLICDQPYYNCGKDDQGRHIVQLNPEYRCKVVRLTFPRIKEIFITTSKEFKVQIFSTETGEWTESIVSLPSEIEFHNINYGVNYIYNGKLFWGCLDDGNFLIGLDPFMISSGSSVANANDTNDHYECHFTELQNPYNFNCIGTYRGCIRMCKFNSFSGVLSVRDLDEEEIFHGGTTVKLCVDNKIKVYSLDREMVPGDYRTLNLMLGFDSSNDDILYLQRGGDKDIVKCDIHTKEWSNMTESCGTLRRCFEFYFPLVLPWWPTPIPRLPKKPST